MCPWKRVKTNFNVIRLLMAQAACNAGWGLRALSFKHTVKLWTEWVSRGLSATKHCARRFTLIAQCRVGNRAGRIEPRKRRPKLFPWLKVPRAQGSTKDRIPWSREGDKVSAIRLQRFLAGASAATRDPSSSRSTNVSFTMAR